MKKLEHQTKQAFLFSLAFYGVAVLGLLFKVRIFPVLMSLSFLLSLLWIVLSLREIIFSRYISDSKRILYVLAIVFFNIFGGIFYFFKWRAGVLGKSSDFH